MERRNFLKLSALSAATAAISQDLKADAPAGDALDPALREGAGNGVRWDKAPCRFCGTGCHVQVGVQDGKVVAIAGDRKAEVNKGLLCVKGYHVGLALYGKDRLTTPLLAQGRQARADLLGRGHRHHRQAHHAEARGVRLLRLRPVDDPRGLRGAASS